jgi:CBS domain-containing protein
MKLSELFTRRVITAEPDETLAGIADLMQEHNVGTVIILEEERPVGIITDRDLALALGARGLARETPVRQVMTEHVLAIPDDTSIFTATRYIRECGVRRLPIVDKEDRVVGMVTLDDLMHCLGQELFNLSEGIRHEMVCT